MWAMHTYLHTRKKTNNKKQEIITKSYRSILLVKRSKLGVSESKQNQSQQLQNQYTPSLPKEQLGTSNFKETAANCMLSSANMLIQLDKSRCFNGFLSITEYQPKLLFMHTHTFYLKSNISKEPLLHSKPFLF